MALADLLKQAAAAGPKKAGRPRVTFAKLRSAMRSDDVPDHEAEALFHAYMDRLNGETEED